MGGQSCSVGLTLRSHIHERCPRMSSVPASYPNGHGLPIITGQSMKSISHLNLKSQRPIQKLLSSKIPHAIRFCFMFHEIIKNIIQSYLQTTSLRQTENINGFVAWTWFPSPERYPVRRVCTNRRKVQKYEKFFISSILDSEIFNPTYDVFLSRDPKSPFIYSTSPEFLGQSIY